MVFLASLRRRPDAAIDPAAFPWSLPLVRDLAELAFTTPVTFLVGENGSGKSTLLEGIAAGMDAVAAGSRDLRRDPSLQPARDFAAGFVFARRRHARTRLFLRAEDVFGYLETLVGHYAGVDRRLGRTATAETVEMALRRFEPLDAADEDGGGRATAR